MRIGETLMKKKGTRFVPEEMRKHDNDDDVSASLICLILNLRFPVSSSKSSNFPSTLNLRTAMLHSCKWMVIYNLGCFRMRSRRAKWPIPPNKEISRSVSIHKYLFVLPTMPALPFVPPAPPLLLLRIKVPPVRKQQQPTIHTRQKPQTCTRAANTHTYLRGTRGHLPPYSEKATKTRTRGNGQNTHTHLQEPHLSERVDRQTGEIEGRLVRGDVQAVHGSTPPPLLHHGAQVLGHEGAYDRFQEQLFRPAVVQQSFREFSFSGRDGSRVLVVFRYGLVRYGRWRKSGASIRLFVADDARLCPSK